MNKRVLLMVLGVIVFVVVVFLVGTILNYENGCSGDKYYQNPQCRLVKTFLQK